MKLIYKSRGAGKTTELIEEAKKLKGYNLIVCRDVREATRLWNIILEKGYKLRQPITFTEFVNGNYYSGNLNAFLIDNADMFLQYLAKGIKIHAVTFTKEETK